MKLPKHKTLLRKAKRSMFGAPPDMRGITSLVTVESRLDNNHPITTVKEMYGSISFYLGGRPITIHGEQGLNRGGEKNTAPQEYLNKLGKLESALVAGLHHLKFNKERFMIREFLNNQDDNDFGSSIMIHIPEYHEKHLFCTFEIASCHFKARLNPDRKELRRHLEFMLKWLRHHMDNVKLGMITWGSRKP